MIMNDFNHANRCQSVPRFACSGRRPLESALRLALRSGIKQLVVCFSWQELPGVAAIYPSRAQFQPVAARGGLRRGVRESRELRAEPPLRPLLVVRAGRRFHAAGRP